MLTNEMKAECWDFLKRAMINVSEDKTKSKEARNMGTEFLAIMVNFEVDAEHGTRIIKSGA